MSAFSTTQFKQPAGFLSLQEKEIRGKEGTETMVCKTGVLLAWPWFLQHPAFLPLLWKWYQIVYSLFKLEEHCPWLLSPRSLLPVITFSTKKAQNYQYWKGTKGNKCSFVANIVLKETKKKSVFRTWAPQITQVLDKSTLLCILWSHHDVALQLILAASCLNIFPCNNTLHRWTFLWSFSSSTEGTLMDLA